MIKKVISFLLILALACAVMPALPARAEIAGTLYIRGELVTDENCADVLGDGRFSYDPAANVLTVRGGCSYQHSVIANYIPKLTIFVARDATMTSVDSSALLIRADTTITGPGLLKLQGPDGIRVGHGSILIIKDANIDADAKYGGIDGASELGYWGNSLFIRNSCVRVTAAVYGAVYDFKSLSVYGCKVIEPEEAQVTDEAILDRDGLKAKSVTIVPPSYDLWIAGKQVTKSNCTDILCTGAFSYDPEANVLTVKGDCTAADTAINNHIEDLTVYVEKSSRLESTGPDYTIASAQDIRITGPGDLRVFSAAGGVCVSGEHTLTVENARLYVTAADTGIASHSEKEKLIVRSSALEVSGARAFGVFGALTLEGCAIAEPVGGKILGGTVVDGDENPAGKVTLKEVTYPLWIAGTQVTDANASDILGDGCFAFDVFANTLTVRGSGVSGAGSVINSHVPGLTLIVAEDTTLTSTGGMNAITTSRDMTVTGPGRLTLKSEAGSGILVNSGAVLTIDSAHIDADARIGISGFLDKEKLIVRNSAVRVAGAEVAVFNFTGGVTLEGCEIAKPAKAEIVDGTVQDGDGNEALTVLIQPLKYDLLIAGTQVDTRNAADVLGDGCFSYDAESNVLTVRGTCTNKGSYVIINRIAGLTLYAAENAVLTGGTEVISTEKDLTVTGPGTLTVRSSSGCAILAEKGAALTFENAAVDVSGRWGIGGTPSGEKLTVRNSSILAAGTNGAICDFDGGVTLEGCEIAEPTGASAEDGAIRDKEGAPVPEVTIQPLKYDLLIAGTQVDARNAADVLGDGCFSYDAETSVLTVRGTTNKDSYVIISHIPGLTLYAAENSALIGGTEVLSTDVDLTVTGPGTLTVQSSSGCAIFAQKGAELTFDNAVVIAGGRWGIAGTPSGEKLTVRNSQIVAMGTDGAICDFDGGITLEDCAVTLPDPYQIADGGICGDSGKAAEVNILKGFLTVSFDLNGHGDPIPPQTVPAGQPAARPGDPAADGWLFGGWYAEAECKTPYDFSAPVNADFTLYAKWTDESSVPLAITALTRMGDVFWFALNGKVPDGARLILAAYEEGRMVAVRVCSELSADSIILKAPETAAVRAYLVSADGTPLCEPRTAA